MVHDYNPSIGKAEAGEVELKVIPRPTKLQNKLGYLRPCLKNTVSKIYDLILGCTHSYPKLHVAQGSYLGYA